MRIKLLDYAAATAVPTSITDCGGAELFAHEHCLYAEPSAATCQGVHSPLTLMLSAGTG